MPYTILEAVSLFLKASEIDTTGIKLVFKIKNFANLLLCEYSLSAKKYILLLNIKMKKLENYYYHHKVLFTIIKKTDKKYYMPSYLSTDTKKIYKLMEVKPITTATII